MTRIALLCCALLWCTAAHPGDLSGSWYDQQKMTPEAQQKYGFGWDSCCDGGDVYKTRFRKVENDGSTWGKQYYQYWKDGQWLDIPPEIVRHEKTPDGQPVLFLYSYHNAYIPYGMPLCFIIGEPDI